MIIGKLQKYGQILSLTLFITKGKKSCFCEQKHMSDENILTLRLQLYLQKMFQSGFNFSFILSLLNQNDHVEPKLPH